MAQDKILGEQLDLADVSGDIANDTTAIDNIATGVANDPTALASLEAGIDHNNIVNGGGTNSHTQIDSHIADSTLHFVEASINITTSQVSDYTTNTTNIADAQIAAASINDLLDVNTIPTAGQLLTYGTGSPPVWEAQAAPISGLQNIVEDISPELGGNLDVLNGSIITANVSTIAVDTNEIRIEPGDNTYVGSPPTASWAGNIYAIAGDASGNNFAGLISLEGGDSYGTEDAGQANLQGGRSWSTGFGGDVEIVGGFGSASGRGGVVNITAGTSNTSATGANVKISAGGTLGGGTAPGGHVYIQGGAAISGYQSGDVMLTPGGNAGIAGKISTHAGYGVVGQGSIHFRNDTNTTHSTGFYTELKASASLASNLTLTLPIVDGLIGQTLQTDASGVLSFDGPALYNGTGTPEGSIAAIVGSLYTDDAGGTGTTLFIKESGTSTVGWVAVSASVALDDLTDVIIGGSPLVTDQVLTYDGENWINADAAASGADNWVYANNGSDFVTTPTGTGTNTVIIGNNATAGSHANSIVIGTNTNIAAASTTAVGYNASCTNHSSVAIGRASDAVGAYSVAAGYNATTSGGGDVAIGQNSKTANSNSVSIGNSTYAGGNSTVALGHNADVTSTSTSSVAIGRDASVQSTDCVVIGYASTSSAANQTIIGPELTSADVTSDVAYSLKAGCGTTGQHNFLHLHSKGKLELVGDEAQFVAPVYTLATLPVVVEGGMIYVSDATGSILTGSQCFGNVSGSPTVWVDVTTGAAVA